MLYNYTKKSTNQKITFCQTMSTFGSKTMVLINMNLAKETSVRQAQ